jgi:pimeloyl-ACP methyl ester carboxylesterase
MRTILAAFLLASLGSAQSKVEVGNLNGAQFRIDVPQNWSGILVMYCHGYSATPGGFDPAKPNAVAGVLASNGVAVAQSGYSAGGWAIEEAVQDTQALLRYFAGKYGAPRETYVMGHSMGGFLTMTLMEKFPTTYSGGLALCGPLAPATWFMARQPFDYRVVFDFYFPAVLPPPDKVPAGYTMTNAVNEKVQALLDSNEHAAADLRSFTRIRTNKELAATIAFFTFILKDLQQRGGGNPFDNRAVVYQGTSDDNALNDGVKRYTADPRAAEYLRTWYTPTGRLFHPMLAIHTTYDPLIPTYIPNFYVDIAARAGSGDLFLQRYSKHNGHCAFSPEETAQAFTDLRQWSTTGKRPQ